MIRFKYAELSKWLREQIATGKYRNGDRIPTENELAEQFHISRDTVRKGLAVLEQENLLYRVKGSGTFVNHPSGAEEAAVMKKQTDSKLIGILMNDIDSYIFPAIVRGINGTLNKYGYHSAIHFTNNCISQERAILLDMMEGDFAGYIIEPTKAALPQPNYDLYQKIANTTPAVLMHAKIPTLPLSSLTMGDEEAGYKLTEYLLSLGHRKIVIVCKFDEQTGTNRYLGYVKAYQKAGIPILDQDIFWFSSERLADVFSEPVDEKLHSALLECSAVICHDDQLAYCLKKYLESHAEYNQELVICGFDDADIASEHNIISMAHPKEKFGEYAAMRLLDKIKNPGLDVSYDFHPKLVVH